MRARNSWSARFALVGAVAVGRMKGVWRIHLIPGHTGEDSGGTRAIVYDGVVYVVSGAGDVFAIDYHSGEILVRGFARSNGDLHPETKSAETGLAQAPEEAFAMRASRNLRRTM